MENKYYFEEEQIEEHLKLIESVVEKIAVDSKKKEKKPIKN